jgi:hypothetical protein
MDEIFGYFPPVANPPSKLPLLTLLKQARAFGVGVVLATQNPLDLDYKALANTGTWFIGRLQTDRDKARVLDGLEGGAAGTGMRFDRRQMGEVLAGLGSRIFLLNNVHDEAPEVFESRWALSYLRGPLTRNQIKALVEPRKTAAPAAQAPPAPIATAAVALVGPPATAGGGTRQGHVSRPPVLPPGIAQYFLPVRGSRPDGTTLLYDPMLLGSATVRFVDAKAGVDVSQEKTLLAPISDEAIPVIWEKAAEVNITADNLEKSPQEAARYAELPAAAGKAKSYDAWSRDLAGWLYGSQKLDLFKRSGSKEFSTPGETERDFRIRLQEIAREERDRWADQLRKKYAPKTAALEERLRRAQQAVEREREQVTHQGLQTAVSFGATLLGAFLGRKAVSASNIGRATTAARGVGRLLQERQDVGRAEETVEALQLQLAGLEAEFNSEMAAFENQRDPLTERLETVAVKPKKTNISVRLVALLWVPGWQDAQGRTTPAWA